MKKTFLLDGRWQAVSAWLDQRVDLEASARQFKAIQRVGKIRDAASLLRLALMYGPGRLSLRGVAAAAGDAGIASLSDKAVLGRLRKMGDWLEYLLGQLLEDARRSAPGGGPGLVDGSVIRGPGSGGNWRVHARYDPASGRFADLVLTRETVGERVERTAIDPGQTMIMDRGYARVRDFKATLSGGADFITRIGWRSLRLRKPDGQPFDPLAERPTDDQPIEHPVQVHGLDRPLRFVMTRIPDGKAAQQRQRAARRANRSGHQITPRTTLAAGYLMLVTSLPDTVSAAAVVAAYRQRWQVELGFKRLKSLGRIDELPAVNPAVARTWLLAHLIAAVITDEMASHLVGFPPSAKRYGTSADPLALAALASGTTHPALRHPAATKDAKPPRNRTHAAPPDRRSTETIAPG